MSRPAPARAAALRVDVVTDVFATVETLFEVQIKVDVMRAPNHPIKETAATPRRG
jgi:hypothetical protein